MPVRTIPRAIHFVGVAGVGVSAIARVLIARGHTVSGSDLTDNRLTRKLADLGATIHVGHEEAHVGDAELIVASGAVPDDNPELAAARQRRIPIWHRAQALAALLNSSLGVGVAGTHGKTTTTCMVARALDRADLDPTVLIGGELADYGGNAKIGRGQHTVAEVDESDGSLLEIHPRWTIITNLEMEHHDHYRDETHLADTFGCYLRQVDPEGGAIVWHDDPCLSSLRRAAPCPIWTYSATNSDADYLMTHLEGNLEAPRFTVISREEGPLCNIALRVPGLHNALNATAVVALAHRMGLKLYPVARALADFGGARRRFDRRGTARGVTVIDDYAHHPTEIRATLRTARAMHRDGRLVALFQPHRFSRTRSLWREFAGALSEEVDHLVVMDVYGAGEPPIDGISGKMIFDALQADRPRARAFCPTLTEAVDHLRHHVQPGDWVVTLGAGDVWQAGEELLDTLTQPRASSR